MEIANIKNQGRNNGKELYFYKETKYKFSLSFQGHQTTSYKMSQQETNKPKRDNNWGTTLYTKTTSSTLTVQGEIYKMDSHPIICIGLEDHQMTRLERQQVYNTKDERGQAQTRKCMYMLNTLDPEETKRYDKLGTPEEATIFLATLVRQAESGQRELRVYQPTKELATQTCPSSGEIPDQEREGREQEVEDYPPLTIKLKPRTCRDQLEIATPAVTKPKLCTLEGSRSDQDKDQATARNHLNLGETKMPEGGLYNPGWNKITGVQGLNYTVDWWYTNDGSAIWPLGREPSSVYQGERALPDHILRALQIQKIGAKEKEPSITPYTGQEDLLSLFDDWILAIHEAIPYVHAKKKVLCSQLQQIPELHPCLTNVAQYELSRTFSYIRLVHECRWRLIRDHWFTLGRYQTCRQGEQERAMDYIDRLREYRLKASGPYQGKWPCDTWEEYLARVTSGLRSGQLAVVIETEKPQDTETLWRIVNREEMKTRRDQSQVQLKTRLEDKFGTRQQKQSCDNKAESWGKCFLCHQRGHMKKQCSLNVSTCQHKQGFRKGSC